VPQQDLPVGKQSNDTENNVSFLKNVFVIIWCTHSFSYDLATY